MTRRAAPRLTAADLLFVLRSGVPTGGSVLSVTVYPRYCQRRHRAAINNNNNNNNRNNLTCADAASTASIRWSASARR